MLIDYYKQELQIVSRFFSLHAGPYTYFRTGRTELDQLYFVRDPDLPLLAVPEAPGGDPEYSTPMDYLFSKFIAFEALRTEILQRIGELDGSAVVQDKVSVPSGITWTGKVVSLCEYPWNSSYAFAENEPISNIDLDGAEKYKVTIRTFLPYTYVWEPQSDHIIDKANTRWYPQYKNVVAHGGFKSEQQFNIDFTQKSVNYLHSVPGTFQKDLETGKVKEFRNGGIGDQGTFSGMRGEKAKIYATISTANPAMPFYLPAPGIDYNLKISVDDKGNWSMKGKWDGFPALEVFIEDVEKKKVDLMFFNNTSDAGKDLGNRTNPKHIFNLIDGQGDVKIDKSGQIGGSPQKDKEKPSPKVKENNNERFKHK